MYAPEHRLRRTVAERLVSSAIGGENVTTTIEGLERYPVNVRYPLALRDSHEAVVRVLVPLRQGGRCPLGVY